MTDRDDWIGADRFVDDTLRYLTIADEYAATGRTAELIETDHVILDRLWWRIEEKLKTMPVNGEEVSITEYLEKELIEAARLYNNYRVSKNTALLQSAHNIAKRVKRELYNITWKLNFILRPKQDAGSSYVRGRAG